MASQAHRPSPQQVKTGMHCPPPPSRKTMAGKGSHPFAEMKHKANLASIDLRPPSPKTPAPARRRGDRTATHSPENCATKGTGSRSRPRSAPLRSSPPTPPSRRAARRIAATKTNQEATKIRGDHIAGKEHIHTEQIEKRTKPNMHYRNKIHPNLPPSPTISGRNSRRRRKNTTSTTPHRARTMASPPQHNLAPPSNPDDEQTLGLDRLLPTIYTSARRFPGPPPSPTPDWPSEKRGAGGFASGSSIRLGFALFRASAL